MTMVLYYSKVYIRQLGKPLLSVIIYTIQVIITLSKNFKIYKHHLTVKRITIGITCASIILLSSPVILSAYKIISTLPSINQLTDNINETTKIYDRNGQLLYSIYGQENRTIIPLSQIPKQVINAHLAIEDANFYHHPGISIPGIIRASWNNLHIAICEYQQKNSCPYIFQGASTITQQVIKNRLLTPERTWERKMKEAILAIQLEQKLTKDEILTLYLNIIPYGGTTYGIEAASQQYFNKSTSELTLGEAAFLAGLPAAPTIYAPNNSNSQKAITRQKQVLQRMLTQGYITTEIYKKIIQEKLEFAPNHIAIQAPHFVMYTKQILEEQKNIQVKTAGLEIKTSLDLTLQQFAENTLNQELERIKSLRVSNGGIIITKPKTGEILAMVGSKNFFDILSQGNVNVTTALRQPGSTIKPLTYAAALNSSIPGMITKKLPVFTTASIINDSPIIFKIPGSPDYKPRNYDGKFHGNITVRTALASSYNIPAVKTLAQIGINELLNFGRKIGITTWDEQKYYGLALTLGSGEIKMTDMAVAYGTFANLGHRQQLNPILSINDNTNENKDVLKSPFSKPAEIDPRVAFLINDILADPQARTPTFGRISKLNIKDHIVAVKTGTTNDLRDNWTIGYTPEYLVAVWVGNFNNTPMQRIASGITGATPIWHTIMQYLLTEYQTTPSDTKTWSPPTGMVEVSICQQTGTLACKSCPGKKEWFIKGTEPTKRCQDSSTTTTDRPTTITSQ